MNLALLILMALRNWRSIVDLALLTMRALWRTVMLTFVLSRLAMRTIILPVLCSPALILASPVITLAALKTALRLLIRVLGLVDLRLDEARLETSKVLVCAPIARDYRRLWWCWWRRIRLAALVASIEARLVLLVARVAAEWLGLIVVLRDEARLVAFDFTLGALPAWHWLWSWWWWERLVAVVAWFLRLLALVAGFLA